MIYFTGESDRHDRKRATNLERISRHRSSEDAASRRCKFKTDGLCGDARHSQLDSRGEDNHRICWPQEVAREPP